MAATSTTILSIQTHPGDSSTVSITGEKYQGDAYYSRSDGFHTVQYIVTDFVGEIIMQATLATSPTADDWFTLTSTRHTSTAINTDESDGSFLKNFVGNYVWVRAIATMTGGTINGILLNH
jgi:glycerol uptake facilitator-like aquaporin